MIYELRLYSVSNGRMPDVLARFEHHLPAMFARHKVKCVGCWTALSAPDLPRFVYLLAYDDYAQREASWNGFYQDSEWARVRAETNAGQEMVERHDLFFLKPNPAWKAAAADEPLAGIHEMMLVEVAAGQGVHAGRFLQEHWLEAVIEAGGQVAAVWDMAAGAGMQKIVLLHTWPNAAAWHSGRLALEGSATLRKEWTRQRKELGTTVFLRWECNLLEPARGAVITASLGRPA